MNYCDIAHELRMEREQQEKRIIKKMAVLLAHYKVDKQPTHDEFVDFCNMYLNVSKATGYRWLKALNDGEL